MVKLRIATAKNWLCSVPNRNSKIVYHGAITKLGWIWKCMVKLSIATAEPSLAVEKCKIASVSPPGLVLKSVSLLKSIW